MNDSKDIRDLLESWPYDPDDDARIVRGKDGREILQVRTPVGLEQLEMQGRPDGVRPHQMGSALEFYQKKLAQARAAGGADEFELNAQDCAELIGEGTLFYLRYLRLFQLNRWAETVRDTSRNLQLFDFIRHYAEREEDRQFLEKWRPYLVRMNIAASALQHLEQGDARAALKVVQSGREQIGALEEMDDETFQMERDRSLAALAELEKQLQQKQPVSPVELLQRQLRRAIERQEFERAAELRDRIRQLRAPPPE
ncbi:MAG TPA: UvrB/UvrC motif-containing protein [Candidatus Sulfotelmatobacter sp.]|nr:UvrB/UvrC motif-containing protein [Candidatus Sulfotelmatobacter sp.]